MERPFPVLEKKLAELQLQLRELFLTDDDASPGIRMSTYRQQMAIDEIQLKIGFLKTLMTAEKDCHAGDTPTHLSHLEKWLAALDDAFHNWVDFRITPEDDLGELAECFCTNSCFGEGESEAEAEAGREEHDNVLEPDYVAPAVSMDVEPLGSERGRSEEDGEWKQRRRLRSSRLYGFMAVAVVVALSLAMLGIGPKFGRVEKKFYLVPT
ncbi:uncharacterized protein [Typha latifolia]|uniref:uncharacterized protein n=1 Tax=Typha latifolia TaxID=4733 RepID=UPI003C2E77BD